MLDRLRLRALRLLAAALVAVVSGVPQAALAAIADDCCAEPCDAGQDGRDCAPNCPSPSCVKVFPPAISHGRAEGVAALERAEPRVSLVVAPVLPLVPSGVFHPPRA
jgi:hypothetical protein